MLFDPVNPDTYDIESDAPVHFVDSIAAVFVRIAHLPEKRLYLRIKSGPADINLLFGLRVQRFILVGGHRLSVDHRQQRNAYFRNFDVELFRARFFRELFQKELLLHLILAQKLVYALFVFFGLESLGDCGLKMADELVHLSLESFGPPGRKIQNRGAVGIPEIVDVTPVIRARHFRGNFLEEGLDNRRFPGPCQAAHINVETGRGYIEAKANSPDRALLLHDALQGRYLCRRLE